MNISLTPALEQFVNDKVATGLYNSVSEVIREALRLLIAQEKPISREEIERLLDSQRKYYRSGATLSLKFRLEQLSRLLFAVKKYEQEINQALNSDLGKSSYEAFMCESGLALTEISYMIKNLKKLKITKQ